MPGMHTLQQQLTFCSRAGSANLLPSSSLTVTLQRYNVRKLLILLKLFIHLLHANDLFNKIRCLSETGKTIVEMNHVFA